MDRAFLPVIGASAIGAVAAIGVGLALPLPRLFPYSDAALLGLAASAVSLGAGMMLPDRWRLTSVERATLSLIATGRVTRRTVKPVIEKIQSALDFAERLRRADNGFREDLARQVRHVAHELEGIANDVWQEPARVSQYGTLLARAALAVEAVEVHAKLRSARQVSPRDIDEAREKVLQTLAGFEGVLDAAARRRIEARMDALEVTASVADGLFKQMRG